MLDSSKGQDLDSFRCVQTAWCGITVTCAELLKYTILLTKLLMDAQNVLTTSKGHGLNRTLNIKTIVVTVLSEGLAYIYPRWLMLPDIDNPGT